jgi:hypothetical protein
MLVKRIIYKHREALGAIGILFSIATIYWPIIKYPFFAEDWQVLYIFANLRNRGLLVESTALHYPFGDPMAFRPVVTFYSAILYIFFGLKPIIFRLFLLSFHFINSLLVAYIVRNITKKNMVSWAAALLYATAARCHLPLFVPSANGFSDVGAVFFALSSFALFLKNRYILSSILFFLAIYTKPPAALLSLILLSYVVILSPKKLNRLWLYLVALSVFLYFLFRVFLRYHKIPLLTFSVTLIGNNIAYYLSSLFLILVPLKSEYPYIFLANLVIFMLLIFKTREKRTLLGREGSSLFFWKVWFIIALLFTCLVTRQRTGYLTYTLIPFIVLLLLFFKELLSHLRFRFPYPQLCLWIMVFVSVIYSGLWVYGEDKKGINSGIFCVRGAYLVRNFQNKFLQLRSVFPSNSVFVFNCGTASGLYWLLGKDKAIRVWCRDDSLRVCGLSELYILPSAMWFFAPRTPNESKIYITPQEPVFLINWDKDDIDIRRISFEELVRLRVDYNSRGEK